MTHSEDLERFARQHHVHYDIQPELAGSGDERRAVEIDIRLFASQPGERLATPDGERCVALAGELARFARELVSDPGIAGRTVVVPPAPVLYESAEQRDVDEVAVTLRVLCEAPAHRGVRGSDDPCAREVRDRLAAIGVRQS